MASTLAACGGFLLAVLWMDLMFDVQVRALAHAPGVTREAVLCSIATYYRRVTTDAFPMNRLIGAVMVAQVSGAAYQTIHAPRESWRLLALMLGTVPIGLALLRIFPAAVRLGRRADPIGTQADLARAIFRDHVLCFVAVAAFTAIEACA